jgi:AcrR family transcriptional regulator
VKANKKAVPKPRRQVTQGPQAQQKILEAVDHLFYAEGARAVGVDAVAKRAGLSKMALYRQFESKDELLLAYLARMEEVFWNHFEASVGKHPDKPDRQVVQFFVDLTARAEGPEFRGCPFVNIAAEFPDPDHPARKIVALNKARLLARLLKMAKATKARNPRRLALGLAFLIEGAYAASQTFAPEERILRCMPDVVRAMIDAELGQV